MKKSNDRPFVLKIALSIFSFFLAICLIEIALEIGGDFKERHQKTPYYRWSFQTRSGKFLGRPEGPLQLVLHPFVTYRNLPLQKTSQFSTNRLGFRGQEVEAIKNRKRIVLLGGSAAFGTGAARDEETIAQILEKKTGCEVLNAGVIGYCSGQELTMLVTQIVDLEPDFVIVLDGFNDFYTESTRGSLEWVAENGLSQIENRLGQRIDKIFFPEIQKLFQRKRVPLSTEVSSLEIDPNIDVSSSLYVKNMTKIERIGGVYGYKMLCLIQPLSPTVSSSTQSLYLQFREKVKKQLGENGVPYADLNDLPLQNEDFIDWMHFSSLGSEKVAEWIVRYIQTKTVHSQESVPPV